MNDTQDMTYGANLAIVSTIGMAIGFGLAALLTAFVFEGMEDAWLWGGPLGFLVSGVAYSLIKGWGEG
jgi:hypothetical protein